MAFSNRPFHFFCESCPHPGCKNGIRVEIFTRLPILVGTGREPIKAEVGKVRI